MQNLREQKCSRIWFIHISLQSTAKNIEYFYSHELHTMLTNFSYIFLAEDYVIDIHIEYFNIHIPIVALYTLHVINTCC